MIKTKGRYQHNKASEEYVSVEFKYSEGTIETVVPIVYPRTGLDLKSPEEITSHLDSVYPLLDPSKQNEWREEEAVFWRDVKSPVTKPIFEHLASDFGWHRYADMPGESSNAARRIQNLKELGYTIATKRIDGAYRFKLLPLPRGQGSGYESWSPALRARIIKTLDFYDAYEGKKGGQNLLPDHKFPEQRWDSDTKRETLEHLTEADIRSDFQLITNQRNQQKREVCRNCFQTGRRGTPYSIPFFHKGGPEWDARIPTRGSKAEAGCIGCGWYDLEAWRQALIRKL